MTKLSQPGLLKRVAKALGPGLVTGAADDDPSGIVTYSMAGAQHGMALLWLAWITWPLMAATSPCRSSAMANMLSRPQAQALFANCSRR